VFDVFAHDGMGRDVDLGDWEVALIRGGAFGPSLKMMAVVGYHPRRLGDMG
jgi:hypothetical protein